VTVMYAHESRRTHSPERLRWRCPATTENTNPTSCQRWRNCEKIIKERRRTIGHGSHGCLTVVRDINVTLTLAWRPESVKKSVNLKKELTTEVGGWKEESSQG
jgi:hypothetical protein